VQFQLDGLNLGSAITGIGPTFSMSWNTASATKGTHTLTAMATDTLGQQTTSSGVTISIASAPSINIVSPTGGNLSGTVTLTANATSAAGIASVQFQLDGLNLGSAITGTGPTFSMSWNTASATNGAHTLTAIATDTLGQQTTSSGVKIQHVGR
jgi:Bacterial Ig domain